MTRSADAIPEFPMTRTCPFDPSPEYAQAREKAPFTRIRMWNGKLAWLATRYSDVQAVLTHPGFSQVPLRPNYPFPSESRAAMLKGEQPPAMNQLDPPEHTKYRRIFAPMFAFRRMEEIRPRVQAIVDRLIEKMLEKGPELDLYQEFALALPSWVMAELFGVPHEDQEFFQEMARTRFSYDKGNDAPLVAGEKMRDYLDQLFARREQDPGTGQDGISRIAREYILPGHVTREQAIVHVRQVLLAGHDTTANMIALGALLLFEHPDQMKLLKDDPSLSPSAVEEMLRYLTIPHFNSSRVAVEDVEISGHRIESGEGVIASLAAANRDPAVFPDPDVFDITRDATKHLAFADGIHQCVGQPIARLELQVVFATLFQRIPALCLAVPFEDIVFSGNATAVYGLRGLPVTW